MTDRTPTSDPVAAAWEALHWASHSPASPAICIKPCAVDKLLARHRPLIEEAIRQQARAAFAAQVAALELIADGTSYDPAGSIGVTARNIARAALLAASPEPASPEASGSGLDVERLTRAIQWLETPDGVMLPPIQPFYDRATAIVREYDRLAARPDGAEADAS